MEIIASTELEFRLYYDHLGRPVTYTTEKIDGNYIVISAHQYAAARMDILIEDGKIKSNVEVRRVYKMIKNNNDGTRTSKYDINILVDDDYNLWVEQCNEIR